tara:strand:+ start:3373 stop:4095 length:723 start_codon:yes stop_codon:yes gene_type:complete
MITNEDKAKIKFSYLEKFQDGTIPMPKMLDVVCETQLAALGDFVPLNIKINLGNFKHEISKYDNKWVPYLAREGEQNDREGLNYVGLEGDTPYDSISLPEVRKRTGRLNLKETDFTVPTELYETLPSLKPITGIWPQLARCTLVKVNKGGWFPYHRDSVLINRKTFRVIAFLTNTGPESYQWEHDYTMRTIEQGRCYYVNTQKAHRTHSYVHDSIHLVMNIPKTMENVFRLMDILRHGET